MNRHDSSVPGVRPVVFGEVLYDVFPEEEVLGGAPFNVAWHLAGFGLDPLFVSRIGEDARGERVRSAMHAWGMDTSALQIDGNRPTGTVTVRIVNDDPRYTIEPDQAYDFIDADTAASSVTDASILLYHGTLATRNPVSAAALERLAGMTEAIFTDVNLRDPWWSAEGVTALLGRTRWLKLNEEELGILMKELHEKGDESPKSAVAVMHEYDIDEVIVTRGAAGACIVAPDSLTSAAAPVSDDRFVDSVGAGDAFASVIITGIIKGWPVKTMLNRAVAFAAKICTIRGATTADTSIYHDTVASWEDDK